MMESNVPPHPPPKLEFDSPPEREPGLPHFLPPIDASASFDALSPGRTPDVSPGPSPSSPSFPEARAKKANPLVDLIETEKTYVEQLTGIIRKVASAWSRSNLPPKDLDLMFRSLEGVYKANRSLLSRLKEIGTNPSSPKALGDLLMRWIDDLETPYTAYAERFCAGFDDWDLVRSNDRLPAILVAFSQVTPPPSLSTGEPAIWALDQLFLLPKARLKYYKKLYGRLLKGTQSGRSDHKLLLAAAEKLERLLATVESRSIIVAGGDNKASTSSSTPAPAAAPVPAPAPAPTPALAPVTVPASVTAPPVPPKLEGEDVADFFASKSLPVPLSPATEGPTGSETSASVRGSGFSSENRHSGETANSTVEPPVPAKMTIPELESRLSLVRCMDIFTMTPKQVKLSLLPPSLPFARQMRCAIDGRITFVPRSTGTEVVHQRARVFVLSDLFLACELDEAGGDVMYLLYPPLAGKFLKVSPVEGHDTQLHLSIMKKEKLTVELASVQLRDRLLADFTECIGFATATHSASKHPMPPLPPALSHPPANPGPVSSLSSSQSAPNIVPAPNQPPSRISSPPIVSPSRSQSAHSGSGTFSPPRFGSPVSEEGSGNDHTRSIAESMSRFADPRRQPGMGGMVSPPRRNTQEMFDDHGRPPRMAPAPGQIMPSFAPGQVVHGGSFSPGQVIPSGGFGPGQVLPPSGFQPGQVVGPPRSASVGFPQQPGSNASGPGGPPSRPGTGMGGPPPSGPPGGPPMQRASNEGVPSGAPQRRPSYPQSPPPGAGSDPQRQPSLPGGPPGPQLQRQPSFPDRPPGSSMQQHNELMPPGPPQRQPSMPGGPPGPQLQRQPSFPDGSPGPSMQQRNLPYGQGPPPGVGPGGPGPQRQLTLPGAPQGPQLHRQPSFPNGPPGPSMQQRDDSLSPPPGSVFPPARINSLPPAPGGPSGFGGPPPPPSKLGVPPIPLGTRSTPTTPIGGGFPGHHNGPDGFHQPPAPPFANVPHRAPSDPSFQGGLRKAHSSHSLHAQFDHRPASAMDAPPMPPSKMPAGPGGFLSRRQSQSSLAGSFSAAMPSERLLSRNPSMKQAYDASPPESPEIRRTELPPETPVTSTISASMKCKIFAKQHHAQWKSLGTAKLRLYRQEPGNVKQLVVEAEDKVKTVLISTIVLMDGVERVGKTGVAVELSDRGARTGIVYMIQLRNETSAQGLYESLLAGSDRKTA